MEKSLSDNTVDAYLTDLDKLLAYLTLENINILDVRLENLEDFNPNQNIKGVKVLFQPQTTVNKDKTRNKLFCSDCQVQEVPDYEEPTEETEADGA